MKKKLNLLILAVLTAAAIKTKVVQSSILHFFCEIFKTNTHHFFLVKPTNNKKKQQNHLNRQVPRL